MIICVIGVYPTGGLEIVLSSLPEQETTLNLADISVPIQKKLWDMLDWSKNKIEKQLMDQNKNNLDILSGTFYIEI